MDHSSNKRGIPESTHSQKKQTLQRHMVPIYPLQKITPETKFDKEQFQNGNRELSEELPFISGDSNSGWREKQHYLPSKHLLPTRDEPGIRGKQSNLK
ncbi:hypothetical protein ACTXT7_002426 [Hymenolepis weldensis]